MKFCDCPSLLAPTPAPAPAPAEAKTSSAPDPAPGNRHFYQHYGRSRQPAKLQKAKSCVLLKGDFHEAIIVATLLATGCFQLVAASKVAFLGNIASDFKMFLGD